MKGNSTSSEAPTIIPWEHIFISRADTISLRTTAGNLQAVDITS